MADGNKKDHVAQLSDHERGRAVSVGTFVDDRPTLEDVRRFKPVGDRDDLVTVELPLYCRRALEIISYAARRPTAPVPMSHVALWALHRGLKRLRDLADVRVVTEARAQLLATGSEHVVQLEEWRYKVQARDGSKPLTVRHVKKSERNDFLGLAAGLGLSQRAAGSVVIIFGLVDAPMLPGELPGLLASEVRAFLDAVRRRALSAQDLAQRAQQSPAPVRQLSWSEVSGED